MASVTTTTPAGGSDEDWPLSIRVAVPIVSVVAFIVVQVILFFVKDPGYAKIDRTKLTEDIEIANSTVLHGEQNPSVTGTEDIDHLASKTTQSKGLSKSSSTTCHMVSREEARRNRQSRRTVSESDVEPVNQERSSETQAHLVGVLRLNHPRTRLISTSSTGTSDEGHATFALSFGKKKRSRSRSTSEVHGTSSPGPVMQDGSGMGLDANQLTISSIKEENEYSSRDAAETRL